MIHDIAILDGTRWDKKKFQCLANLNVSVNTKDDNLCKRIQILAMKREGCIQFEKIR